MAKVFRFHEGINTIQDWQASQVYGKKEIEGIADPTGLTASKQITSIPSPFARMDLVQTAFHYLAQPENSLDGDTIYHKIVSDALDIGELFFNIDQLQSKYNIKIIPWDKVNDLNTLLNSSSPKLRLYGETLKLYLDQDFGAYNFDSMKSLYLLEYDHKVIGGTSPATLFFTTGNKVEGMDIAFGNDTILDSQYQPLYNRDHEYQKYLHHLLQANPEIGNKMKNVKDYLNRCLKKQEKENHQLYDEIKNLKKEDFDSAYDELDTGKAGSIVEVIGCAMRKKSAGGGIRAAQNSDFIINSEKYTGANKPMVLQNNLNKTLCYTTDNWNKNVPVPYMEEESVLDNRYLPGQVIQYPYLTVSDFLEDQLVRTIYTTNSKQYFNGNLKIEAGDPGKGYLLPVKPLFFQFFNTEQLMGKMHDGKPMIEIVQRAMNSVTVTLRLPIAKEKEYISFERIYFPPLSDTETAVAQPKQNKGAITEGYFNIVLFPFFRHPAGVKADYRAMVIDRDTDGYRQKNHYELVFFNNSEIVGNTGLRKQRSDKKNGDSVSSAFYVVQKEFDYIQVQNGTANGMLLPLLPNTNNGATAYSFAIDFGTSNTHIEWKKQGESKETYPFEITPLEMQYAGLIDPALDYLMVPELQSWIEHELIPAEISKQSPYHFPQRTLLSFAHNLNYNDGSITQCLADFNIPFIYERQPLHSNTAIRSNLKWSDEEGNQILVRRYFENLIFLIRNKILLNGGNLGKTEIMTFFPSSMDEGRRKAFNDILAKPEDGVLAQYFPDTVKHTSISESLAPYYYAFSKKGISSSDRPVATIDIGGGTTDIMVFHKEQPAFLTSFRFAAHSVFGDGVNSSKDVNGFVQKYFKGLDGNSGYAEKAKGIFPLPGIFNEMEAHASADITSFLFSLADNQQLKEKQKKISLFEDLSNDKEMKIPLVVFAGAILYHLALCTHQRKLPPPKTIILSGNGSKIFAIAEGSTGFDGMNSFARAIFKKVYGENGNLTIQFLQDVQPKELTCKGGLFFNPEELFTAYNKGKSEGEQLTNLGKVTDALKYIHWGGTYEPVAKDNKIDVKASENEAEEINKGETIITEISYDDIEKEPSYKKAVKEQVKLCITHLFEILEDPKLGIAGIFRINEGKLDGAKSKLEECLTEDLELGITNKIKELKGKTNKPLDETLFFYPFAGGLNKMAFALAKGLI
jgi:hypothetical protein